jgi:hypothetical protein
MNTNNSHYKFNLGYSYNLKYAGGSRPDKERIILCLSNTDKYKIDVLDVADGKQKTYYRYKCYDIVQLSHQPAINKATLLDRISQLTPKQLASIYQKYILVNSENCSHIGGDVYTICNTKPPISVKLLCIGNRYFYTDDNGYIIIYICRNTDGINTITEKHTISKETFIEYLKNNTFEFGVDN